MSSMYLVGDNAYMIAPDDDESFALVTIKTNRPINWWKELHENALAIADFIVKYTDHGEAQLFVMCSASFDDKEATKILRKAWNAAPDDVPLIDMATFVLIDRLAHGISAKE